jgi:hypothetical protein
MKWKAIYEDGHVEDAYVGMSLHDVVVLQYCGVLNLGVGICHAGFDLDIDAILKARSREYCGRTLIPRLPTEDEVHTYLAMSNNDYAEYTDIIEADMNIYVQQQSYLHIQGKVKAGDYKYVLPIYDIT